MSARDPRSWLDKLVGACLSLFLGALAIYFAVRLIQSVWPALFVILGVAAFLAAAVMVLRNRRQGW